MFENFISVIQIIIAIAVVLLVIIQPSRGSDLGAIAGNSSSNGGKAYIDPMTKVTGFLILLLIASSFFVNYIDKEQKTSSIVVEKVVQE